ncbi:MAG: hypothetical protein V1816_27955 [Pseudomonadota bacterium]
MPEKARLLKKLKEGNFNVPPFIHLSAQDFRDERLDELAVFLKEHCRDFKVIARSAHPAEDYYKGGTFDSMETYADIGGIVYARKRMINHAQTRRRLSIMRQMKFNHAPPIEPDEMGVIVMPFLDGTSIMAKMLSNAWEFGYSGSRGNIVETDPFITQTPHDLRLLQISQDIQAFLGFKCEIEFMIAEDGEIFVVQAKDISEIETLEARESERTIKLDGIRRIRKRRNFRERPIYVMDNKAFYLDIIGKCEEVVLEGRPPDDIMEDIRRFMDAHEADLEDFALRHQRFAVVGLTIQPPEDIFQAANHYLDDYPDVQKNLSAALRNNMYRVDEFIAESDTLLAKDKYRLNFATHDAYGVDTVRNPIWNVFWNIERHNRVVRDFRRLGFKTGDCAGIEIGVDEKPVVYRL